MTLQAPPPEAVPPPMPADTYVGAPEIPVMNKGYAGPSPFHSSLAQDDFIPIPDRWRIGFPTGYRPEMGGFGRVYDPYNQNVLKGDYPFWGNDKFLVLTATSDTIFEYRKLPTPSGVSSLRQNSIDFFGNGNQYLINQNLILSIAIFKGDAGYRPIDWQVKLTPVFNLNYVQLEEVGLTDPDVAPYLPVYTLLNKTTGHRVQTTDPGRALISGKWNDIGRFKGPVLRALSSRAPYFHNGAAATLDEVVDFYERRFGIGLTAQERADLLAFLRAL